MPDAPRPSRLPPSLQRSLPFILLVAAAIGANALARRHVSPRVVPYSEVIDAIRAGRCQHVELGTETIECRTGPEGQAGSVLSAVRLPGMDERFLFDELDRKHVRYTGNVGSDFFLQVVVANLAPFAVLAALFWFMSRRMGGGRGSPLSFGRSKVKVYDKSLSERVTFEDVAGVDEAQAELVEVVDFLKNPGKYESLGARIPKGVLLVGPPGTGKTLLAKAVAGEAAVPFFSISGSEFVEMFVGVGAARMRDLFEQAKERAPCIVFIDELDAIGKSRAGVAALSAHDEREQTLNQLLVEMDGFQPGTGVVIMAATNRPEVLDQALVRAGRFDRQVLVDRPDVKGREEILRVHTRKLKTSLGAELRVVAQRTPGMVGADLANVVNEAALGAARRGSKAVEMQDFEEAIDRVQLGLKKRGRTMNEQEKRRVAFHESGHALVALSVANSDPVHRVTIIPRSIGALGVTLQLPTEERYLLTKDELLDRICVMLGGRCAEEAVFGDVSTGAQNDLERATETARQMVTRFGMSERLGAQTFGHAYQSRFLDMPMGLGGEERNYSEETARAVDEEIARILREQLVRARSVVAERRAELDAVTARLLEVETVDRVELEKLAAPRNARDAESAVG